MVTYLLYSNVHCNVATTSSNPSTGGRKREREREREGGRERERGRIVNEA